MAHKKKGSASARNRMARLLAVQAIYQMHMTDNDIRQILHDMRDHSFFKDKSEVEEEFVDYNEDILHATVRAYHERKDDIEGFVKGATGQNDIDILLKCVLYAGATEIMVNHDVDAPIIINDYITAAQSFFAGNESKLVNAALDKLSKQLRG